MSRGSENRIVTFRDGPQLLPFEFVTFADSDSYPDLTYQEWIHRVVNKKIESNHVSRAIVSARSGLVGR